MSRLRHKQSNSSQASDSVLRFLNNYIRQLSRMCTGHCPKKLRQILHIPFVHDSTVTILFLFLGTLLAFWLDQATSNLIDVSFAYMLAVVIAARFTSRYIYGIIGSVLSIICINFFFTYPYMNLNFTLAGYPVAFFSMLIISSFMSAATTSLKKQSLIIADREKQLALAEKEKMRANLLRAISHDLRTPLTGIIGSANTYMENTNHLSEQEKLKLITNIQEDANWLLNMVENILTVTRIHTKDAQVTKSLEPIEEVVSEAVQRLQKRIPDAQINVRVPEDFLMIPMDAILIEQVIMNLIENAVMHSHSTQPTDCYVTCDESSVSFHVRDYGVGIPKYKLPDIFNGTGSSVSTTPDGKKGMGIGLSICKTIVNAHNGTIEAYNMDQGAEFCFSLPREEKENQEITNEHQTFHTDYRR